MLALLREVVDEDGHTVVMVTHDPVAAAHADRVILLADGRLAGMLDAPSADAGRRAARASGGLSACCVSPSSALAAGSARSPARWSRVFASAVLVMAGGMTLESALRTHPPVERYAAATAVVTGQQIVGSEHDVPLGERARVSSTLVRSARRRPRSPRRDRRRVRPGMARRPDHRRPRLGQRSADALRAERRTPARRARRGRHGLPCRARLEAAPRVHRSPPHRHGRRRRSPSPSGRGSGRRSS